MAGDRHLHVIRLRVDDRQDVGHEASLDGAEHMWLLTALIASPTSSTYWSVLRTTLEIRDMTSDAGTPFPATSPNDRQTLPSSKSMAS